MVTLEHSLQGLKGGGEMELIYNTQAVADRLKGIIDRAKPSERRVAFEKLHEFEGMDWQPFRFHEAMQEVGWSYDVDRDAFEYQYQGEGRKLDAVVALIERYGEMIGG